MKHHLKILENFATDILQNGKSFEVRRNDREFKPGDTITFITLDAGHGGLKDHPINEKTFSVEYVLRFDDFPAGLQEGFAVLAIKESKERKKADFAEEAIRCAICRNPNANERGCDGACQVDEKKLESILKQINGEKPKEWHEVKDEYSEYYECPFCYAGVGVGEAGGDPEEWGWHYCPECGARLDGVKRHTDWPDEEEEAEE